MTTRTERVAVMGKISIVVTQPLSPASAPPPPVASRAIKKSEYDEFRGFHGVLCVSKKDFTRGGRTKRGRTGDKEREKRERQRGWRRERDVRRIRER